MTKLLSTWYGVVFSVMVIFVAGHALGDFIMIESNSTERFAHMHNGLHPDAYKRPISNGCYPNGTQVFWYETMDGHAATSVFKHSRFCDNLRVIHG